MRSLVFALIAAMSLGCGSSSDAATSGATDADTCHGVTPGAKGPGAFDPDYQHAASFFTRMSSLEDGSSIHRATRIWYSCNVYGLLDQPKLEVPEGTVAIKLQARDENDAPDAMRVMIKMAKGSPPKAGDFAYEARDPDGTHATMQSASFCFGCHQGYPSTGFLAGTTLTN